MTRKKYDKQELIKMFTRVLKENKCFTTYIHNLLHNEFSLNDTFDEKRKLFIKCGFTPEFMRGCVPTTLGVSELLCQSFHWRKTLQGDAFWRKIYDFLSVNNMDDYESKNYKRLKAFLKCKRKTLSSFSY